MSPRHGGESVAEVLRAHGIKYVFTLVGGHISPILVACEKVGIRIVDTRHEATAVFAADAVARLSGADSHEPNKTKQKRFIVMSQTLPMTFSRCPIAPLMPTVTKK